MDEIEHLTEHLDGIEERVNRLHLLRTLIDKELQAILKQAEAELSAARLRLDAERVQPSEEDVTIEVDATMKPRTPRRRKDDQ